ncbi:ABC transporter permease [Tepidiforma thermophila]|uniref:Peptide/nickel transport system permease protein n=1 Tax=Tepidiforma thermophila (strain KCTC 52669 / CGMCC 1.13589 / G233) TaxID=2761530 RepID=A0A2A9HEN4_TEPT2|nr:ABC transporter permease [Tepidiforma thermophila]PFG73601.1 peptide/nickel transport system permease protein [Tepidiforma thermophila]
MRTYILRRLALFPVTLLGVSILSFTLIRALPADAATIRLGASGSACEECIAVVKKELGLDKSKPEQYLLWLGNALRGDFGLSTATRREITPELRDRFFTTLQLGLVTVFFTLAIGVPIGALSAVRAHSVGDYTARFFSILGLSVPNFWLGTLVIYLPAYWWGWTPVKQWRGLTEDPVTHFALLVLPALVLAIGASAYVARIVRSSMIEALYADYVRTARAKGLKEQSVVWVHVFRNSVLTLLTVLGLQFGLILGGSIVIEQLFGIPGMGSMAAKAVADRDHQTIQAVTVTIAASFLMVTLIVDVLYAWADPRLRV